MTPDRLTFKKETRPEITIRAKFDEKRQKLLILWIVLWSFAGLGVISQFFFPHQSGMETYLIVWLGFWIYFEYKAIAAYRWRIYGMERIRVENESLVLSFEVAGRALPLSYKLNGVKELQIAKLKPASIMATLNNSYWNRGNPTLVFKYEGKEVGFGLDLDEVQSRKVISFISPLIKAASS